MKIKTKFKFSRKTSDYWVNDLGRNLSFLKAQERWMEDKLRVRGYLFLNEVLEALDLDPLSYGYRYGWVWNDIVDFGIGDEINAFVGHKINARKNGKAINLEFKDVRQIEHIWLDAYQLKKFG